MAMCCGYILVTCKLFQSYIVMAIEMPSMNNTGIKLFNALSHNIIICLQANVEKIYPSSFFMLSRGRNVHRRNLGAAKIFLT
jgi:hypothetical protein